MQRTLLHLARCAGTLALTAWLSPLAPAADLFNFTGMLTAANSLTQTGRLNSDTLPFNPPRAPQNWLGSELFPGITASGSTFNYLTLTLTPTQLAGGPYVQIEVDNPCLTCSCRLTRTFTTQPSTAWS